MHQPLGRQVVYTEADIISQYKASLSQAVQGLSELNVADGGPPRIQGLNGWVFEQTVRHCLVRELSLLGLTPKTQEQVGIGGRSRLDLLIGRAAIEIKARGSFGASDAKYARYRATIERRGWVYLYITMQETHTPYRAATVAAFGSDRAFFLDTVGDWRRFVRTVADLQNP